MSRELSSESTASMILVIKPKLFIPPLIPRESLGIPGILGECTGIPRIHVEYTQNSQHKGLYIIFFIILSTVIYKLVRGWGMHTSWHIGIMPSRCHTNEGAHGDHAAARARRRGI